MPVWGWILIAVIVVAGAVAIVAGIAVNRRHRTASLKERFGPEYERTVSAAGEQKAAENELAARERKRDKLDIRPADARGVRGIRPPLADGANRVRR